MINKRTQYLLVVASLTASLQLSVEAQDGFRPGGQLSTWLNFSSGSDLPLWGGVRYIPQVNLSRTLENGHTLDAELSCNLYGTAGTRPFDTISASGKLKPYRAWARYSTDRFEVRAGLQKLNFGSAAMLRPLMWFDQIDPRDPLQLTDGVWGILARYYFLNNANVWLWGLYGNGSTRGWDIIPSNRNIPEFGGRLQVPLPGGEAAMSYHHRAADSRKLPGVADPIEKIPENKLGFDAKWDLKAGLWVEGSWTHRHGDIGILRNQAVLNTGIDYTFSIGSGLYVACEQLLLSVFDVRPAVRDASFFTVVTARYPLGLFDNLSTILYCDWKNENIYSFVNWHRQYDNVTLYLMAWLNPESFSLPAQQGNQNIFAGKGIQLMFVYNH